MSQLFCWPCSLRFRVRSAQAAHETVSPRRRQKTFFKHCSQEPQLQACVWQQPGASASLFVASTPRSDSAFQRHRDRILRRKVFMLSVYRGRCITDCVPLSTQLAPAQDPTCTIGEALSSKAFHCGRCQTMSEYEHRTSLVYELSICSPVFKLYLLCIADVTVVARALFAMALARMRERPQQSS